MYRAVIVDDEELMREYAASFLPWEQEGFRVIASFQNGKEALAFIQSNPVDLVLTDVLMPIMDGIELAKQIRELPKPPVVLFFSAHADFEYAKQAIEHDVAGYVLKSDSSEVFQHALAKARKQLEADKDDLSGSDSSENQEGATLLVRQALSYIREHYNEEISLNDVASHVAVHPAHLSRCISSQLNRSYTEILTEIRLDAAKKLLKASNLRIYEVASSTGYKSSKYFIEAFRKETGMTPQAYRDQVSPDQSQRSPT